MNIAIYSRKSKFVDKSESTNNQINICKDYCNKNLQSDEDINFFIYEDEGFSGKNVKRPAFSRMVKDLNKKEIKVVICYKLDRISRNVSDFNDLVQKLDKSNIGFISVKEQFDTTTAIGRAMMLISAVFAQLERETIGERIKDNLGEISKTGRFINNTAPLGFTKTQKSYTDANGKVKKYNILEVNDDEMSLVKLIFQKYLEFNSINKVSAYLLLNGYKTRKGYEFQNASVRRILVNPFYCCADETAFKYFADKDANHISDISKWTGEFGVSPYRRQNPDTHTDNEFSKVIFAVGSHEPIISSSDWIKIQDIILSRRLLNRRRDKAYTLLSGVIKCSLCGSYMRPQSMRKDGSFYYVCERKEKSKKQLCNNKNIRGDIFDEHFIADLSASLKEQIDSNSLNNTFSIFLNTSTLDKDLKSQIKDTEDKIIEIENIISKLVVKIAMLDDKTTIQYISSQIEQYHKDINDLKNKIVELEEEQEQLEKTKLNSSLLKESIDKFLSPEFSEEKDLLKKRLIIRNFIKTIWWNGEIAEIEFI